MSVPANVRSHELRATVLGETALRRYHVKETIVSDGSGQIRVLAVDDHALTRQGIAVLVGTQPDMALVAEAANGREAI